mmetsp:Transcript_46230/g.77057  ORF Transcript_46230/g.77057 Transcript_46230/m.77057 type:complete len:404 (-) Transcript_46230:193-1404(-)
MMNPAKQYPFSTTKRTKQYLGRLVWMKPWDFFTHFLDQGLNNPNPSTTIKVLAAVQYSVASLGIMFANKIVLTSYDFPSFAFLTLCQFAMTVCILNFFKFQGWINFPDHDMQMFGRVFPLQILFLVATVCSLGGTKSVNMPMFVMLRRFTILFTMIAEYFVAGITQSRAITACLLLLCAGAFVVVTDFSVSVDAVAMILTANVCQALTGVISKQKMDVKDGLGTYGLLNYNSMYSLLCFFPFFTYGRLHAQVEEVVHHENWGKPFFVALFLFSCVMASMLNFSILLCTKVNSALSTMVVGVIKNVVTTYLGMFVGNDYSFTWMNFAGLNVSVVGSLVYTWIKYKEDKEKNEEKRAETEKAAKTGLVGSNPAPPPSLHQPPIDGGMPHLGKSYALASSTRSNLL